MPLGYLGCFAVVLRGIRQTYICSKLRISPYFEIAYVSTTLVLFLTCIKIVVHVLVCAHAIAHIK